MLRTSLFLPPALHQQLLLMSKQEGKSLSDVVREATEQFIDLKQKQHRERMYAALDAMQSVGSLTVTDASTTIDETLYGEQGAWKGQRDK